MDRTAFVRHCTGAKHIREGKICEDSSSLMMTRGKQVIVVSDGHGSKMCCRSRVGANKAVSIARKEAWDFCGWVEASMLHGYKGAVTTRPAVVDRLWEALPTKQIEEMNDFEQMKFLQERDYYEQTREIVIHEQIFRDLFETICRRWRESVLQHSIEYPFTEEEKALLGDNDIAKAYGTTLMLYIETSQFWMAFQIGDGRMVAVENDWSIHEIVPWDYRCFQNITTSMCDSNAPDLFRYAFDGSGEKPMAIFCCSDGVEDSYGDYSIDKSGLNGFYKGLLEKIVEDGVGYTADKLEIFLSFMSEMGSKDDVTIASIIDKDELRRSYRENKKG